jgi:hypothetical protein
MLVLCTSVCPASQTNKQPTTLHLISRCETWDGDEGSDVLQALSALCFATYIAKCITRSLELMQCGCL